MTSPLPSVPSPLPLPVAVPGLEVEDVPLPLHLSVLLLLNVLPTLLPRSRGRKRSVVSLRLVLALEETSPQWLTQLS